MPFCSSCGAEIIPGNRYCTECGAAVESSPVSVTPVPPVSPGPPPVLPAKIRGNKVMFIIIGIAVICIILAGVFFSGMVLTKPRISSSSGAMQNVSVTPTGYAIVSTLGPDTAITPGVTPTSKIEDSARFGSDYERVYSISKKFSFGQKELFSQNVTTPPLYIKFDLTPVKINRHILVGIGTHQEHMENVTENSPNAWFEVKVFNIIDESLAYDEGFGNDFSDMTNQEFMVRQPGKYRIEMSGHEVFANVTILTGIQ